MKFGESTFSSRAEHVAGWFEQQEAAYMQLPAAGIYLLPDLTSRAKASIAPIASI